MSGPPPDWARLKREHGNQSAGKRLAYRTPPSTAQIQSQKIQQEKARQALNVGGPPRLMGQHDEHAGIRAAIERLY